MHCPRRLQNSKTPKLSGAETTDAGLRTLSWNSLRQLVSVSTNGAVVVRYTYDAWGNLLFEECSVPALASNRYRFQGREWSATTGLYNFRARWYDPETGRWLSKDPIGLAGGLNLYAFCGNEPMDIMDPLGLWGIWFGPIHLGNDEPWLVFNRNSLDDLKRGAAATADGIVSAATCNGLLGLFDPSLFDSYYDSCDFDTKVSHALGSVSYGIATIAFAIPQGFSNGSAQVVTHWGPSGMTGIRSGDWVMTGGNTFRNWLMAGGPQKINAWSKSVTTTVPKSSLAWPSGWEWIKGLIGQRIYMP